MAKGNRESGIQIGTASLILIFVVLTLVIFALLSVTSALADNRLTERTEAWITGYYKADLEAERRMAALDKLAEEGVKSGGDFATYMKEHSPYDYDITTGIADFKVKINENANLEVQARFFPDYVEGKHFEIEKWQEVNAREYNIDDSMPVWNGEELLEMEE